MRQPSGVSPLRRSRRDRDLVDNAIWFTPPGGSIEVGWQNGPAGPMLTVADEGPGIDEEVLPRIFDPMVRAADARHAGAGLGLAIARRLVESQGGSIEAHNRPGGGAIFTIRLRAASTPGTVAARSAQRDPRAFAAG